MNNLERQIESLRKQMYKAYNENSDEKFLLKKSTELDTLLNKLNNSR